jgi:hypothetical protein
MLILSTLWKVNIHSGANFISVKAWVLDIVCQLSATPKNKTCCLKKTMSIWDNRPNFFCCLNRFGPLSQKTHGFWDNGPIFLKQQIFRSSQQINQFGEPFSVGWSANQIFGSSTYLFFRCISSFFSEIRISFPNSEQIKILLINKN